MVNKLLVPFRVLLEDSRILLSRNLRVLIRVLLSRNSRVISRVLVSRNLRVLAIYGTAKRDFFSNVLRDFFYQCRYVLAPTFL